MWSILTFGKHKGKSLPQILLSDPDWFFWAAEDGALDRDGFADDACLLDYRARNIKIPKPNPGEWCVRYTTLHRKFANLEIIKATTPCSHDSPSMFRGYHIDLSVPRLLKGYDKLGCKLILKQFKYYFLGSRNARLTRHWCDQFFANPNNFVGPREKPLVSPANLSVNPDDLFPRVQSPPVDPIDHISETQDDVSDEEWLESYLSWSAEYRKRLEQEAVYSEDARERLLAEIEQEERRKALAVCAEDERRREAIKAEAEESSLNGLFPQTDS